MKVYQLTYRSEAIPEISAKEIEDILDEAKTHNSPNGITGCLVYHNGNFIQLLEGEEEKVLEIYSYIKTDKRHQNPHVISKGWGKERVFKDWNMAYIDMAELKVGDKEKLLKMSVDELTAMSDENNYTLNLFWYNIFILLNE
ncbi:BLUF domain-containing protein [uncultured Muriicola sp.]|uniref:BLUF domain-containing protein n=1 Tax=uncultured Muriicola sp. TaxID=1583102 RepID=UPI0026195486|nr:BLUF domain-containing protein [uncultured Muriicola sp.]